MGTGMADLAADFITPNVGVKQRQRVLDLGAARHRVPAGVMEVGPPDPAQPAVVPVPPDVHIGPAQGLPPGQSEGQAQHDAQQPKEQTQYPQEQLEYESDGLGHNLIVLPLPIGF